MPRENVGYEYVAITRADELLAERTGVQQEKFDPLIEEAEQCKRRAEQLLVAKT